MLRIVLVTLGVLLSSMVMHAQLFSWEVVGEMSSERQWHRSHVLPDGRIVILGGVAQSTRFVDGAGTDGVCTPSVDIFDPLTQVVTPAAPMTVGRAQFASVLTSRGTILVFGGMSMGSPRGACTDRIEEYDPVADQWTVVGKMSSPRRLHSALELADGRIVVCGGALSNQSTVSTTEVFDPITKSTVLVSDMPTGLKEGSLVYMPGFGPTYVGGRTGGANSARPGSMYVFVASVGGWEPIQFNSPLPFVTTAVSVSNTTMIACGGSLAEFPPSFSRGVYRFQGGEVARFLEMPESRALHAMVGLGDNTALISGGLKEDLTSHTSTIIVDEELEEVLLRPNHVIGRALHTLERVQDEENGTTYFAFGGLTANGQSTRTIERLSVMSQGALRQTMNLGANEIGTQDIPLFPNPADSHVSVLSKPNEDVVIRNVMGQICASVRGSGEHIVIPVKNLPPGVYSLVNGKTNKAKSFVIQR